MATSALLWILVQKLLSKSQAYISLTRFVYISVALHSFSHLNSFWEWIKLQMLKLDFISRSSGACYLALYCKIFSCTILHTHHMHHSLLYLPVSKRVQWYPRILVRQTFLSSQGCGVERPINTQLCNSTLVYCCCDLIASFNHVRIE